MPWFETGQYLFGPVLGAFAPFVLVALAAAYFTSAHVRRLGVEMVLWCVAYVVYLLAVLHPLTMGREQGWPAWVFAMVVVGLAALVHFCRTQRRAEEAAGAADDRHRDDLAGEAHVHGVGGDDRDHLREIDGDRRH